MTEKQIEISEFLAMPVADGIEGFQETRAWFQAATGKEKERARRILGQWKLMLDKLAPATLSKKQWEALQPEVLKAVPY